MEPLSDSTAHNANGRKAAASAKLKLRATSLPAAKRSLCFYSNAPRSDSTAHNANGLEAAETCEAQTPSNLPARREAVSVFTPSTFQPFNLLTLLNCGSTTSRTIPTGTSVSVSSERFNARRTFPMNVRILHSQLSA